MIPIKRLAEKYLLSEKDIHKILLEHSNNIQFQFIYYANLQYCIPSDIDSAIKRAQSKIDGWVYSEAAILSQAAPVIPIDTEHRIYFLIKDNMVVYVGITNNIMSRIGTHRDTKQFNSVSTFVVNKDILSDVELINIYTHNPTLNKTSITQEGLFRMVIRRCEIGQE